MYKIINRRKKYLVSLVDIFGRIIYRLIRLFSTEEKHSSLPPKKILIIRFAYIGDVILTLPVFPLLRKMYPNAEITFLTAKKTAPLIEHNPYIHKLLTFDAPWFFNDFSLDKLREYRELIRKIRREQYDFGIDMRADIRNIIFILFMGKIKRRISFGFGGGAYLLTDIVPYRRLKHKAELHIDMMKYLGTETEEPRFEIFLTEEEKVKGRDRIARKQDPNRPYYVAIHPGARVPLKQWDIKNYAALADKIVQNHPVIIILLGEKNDSQSAEKILANIGEHSLNLTGQLELRSLLSVIGQCDVLIGNDSAPMHIGVAMNTPTVTIFGPSKSMETGPYFYGHCVIEKNFICRYTCDETNCHYKEYKACMNSISVDTVYKSFNDLVEKLNLFQEQINALKNSEYISRP